MIGNGTIFMLGEMDSGTTSTLAGIAVSLLIFLLGAAKCYSISSRPGTNRKCAFSLMFVLLSFVVFFALAMLVRVVNAPTMVPIFRAIFFGLGLALAATGFLLGILGLREMGRDREKYTQGRSQATFGIAVSVFVMFIIPMAWLAAPSNPQANLTPGAKTTEGRVLRFDEYNFSYVSPGSPWRRIDLSRINKESRLSFTRQSPEAYVSIVAETPGADSDLDNDQLVDFNSAHVESIAISTRILSKEPLRVNNLNGILVRREAQIKDYHLFYLQWFVATNGYAFQVMGYCNIQDRSMAENELRGMLQRFNLLDTRRLAVPAGQGFTNNFESPAHYYTVEVTNSEWHVYGSLAKYDPDAEFGASRNDSCFMVIPVWLGGQEIDSEALTAGLLANMNIEYPDEDLTRRQEIDQDGAKGLQFDYQRTITGNLYRYRLRVLRQGEFGYLVAAWTSRPPEQADAVLNDGLSRVHIHAPTTITLHSLLPTGEKYLKTQAFVYNQAGLFYFKSEDYEKALPLFKAAAANRKDDLDYLKNALLTLCRLGRVKEGLDYVQSQAGALLKKPEIQAYVAFYQSRLSQTSEAITNYAAVFSGGYRDESDFKDYIDLLIDAHQYDQALKEVQAYLAAGDSSDVRMLTGNIYKAMGNHDKALAFFKGEHEKAPFNARITRSLVQAFLDAGRPADALALCKDLVKDAPDSYLSFYLKSRAEISLKWYKDAKASLESAARLEPSNDDVKSSLDYVSSLLGEGNNSMIKNPIDPVPLPAPLTNWPAEFAMGEQSLDYGSYYQRYVTALYYKPHSEYKATDYLTIKVLDTTGVAAFSTFQTVFDPLGEDIYVNEARVTDASGKLISTVDPGKCYVIDGAFGGNPSSRKVLNIPIPGLQPGCEVSLVITRRSGSPDEFPFFQECFSHSYPTRGAGVYLQGNGEGLTIKSSPGVKRETFPEGVFFSMTNSPIDRFEPMQPPTFSFLPAIWIADHGSDWNRLGSNYLASISDRLQAGENVRTKAQELTRDLQNRESKIAVLARFVQTNTVYKAIEFGRHSRTPNTAADTLHNSYGDCKDHAVLLQQLLDAAGIPANLALVATDDPVQTNMPSLDQFNHMVVEISGGRPEEFIDCTAKGAELPGPVPPGLAEHVALVLDRSNAHLTQIPAYPEHDSHCTVQQQVSLVDTNALSVDETVTLTGTHAIYMREYLSAISPSYRQEAIHRDLGLGDAKITRLKVNFLDDPTHPLEIEYAFTLDHQFRQSEYGLVGKLAAGLERYYLSSTEVAKRLSPFELTVPFEMDSEVVFELPKGYRIPETADLKNDVKNRFLAFKSDLLMDTNKIKLSFHYYRHIGKYDAVDYSNYLQAEAQALAALDAEVGLQKIRK